jgi:hypothetical protein
MGVVRRKQAGQLIVNTHVMLAPSIAAQCFQPIGRWYPEIVQRVRVV